MNRVGAVTAVLLLAVACDQASGPVGSTLSPAKSAPSSTVPTDQLKQLLASNATVIGYLQTPDEPQFIASLSHGYLQWRTDATRSPIAQGQVEVFTGSDRTCIGFENKFSPFATQGPEQYLICEAQRSMQVSNSLPRGQDFRFGSKTLFLQYQPPGRTGFTQYYYASRAKQ